MFGVCNVLGVRQRLMKVNDQFRCYLWRQLCLDQEQLHAHLPSTNLTFSYPFSIVREV